MPDIQITIANKTATVQGSPTIICGNSDYKINFSFDSEWGDYTAKTMRLRFYQNGVLRRYDAVFTGNTVALPALYDIPEVEIGVYAGNIRTTTPARVQCDTGITDGDPTHDAPTSDVYQQLMAYLAGLQGGGEQVGISELEFIGTDLSTIGIAETEE